MTSTTLSIPVFKLLVRDLLEDPSQCSRSAMLLAEQALICEKLGIHTISVSNEVMFAFSLTKCFKEICNLDG
jgi:hypothetical protein